MKPCLLAERQHLQFPNNCRGLRFEIGGDGGVGEFATESPTVASGVRHGRAKRFIEFGIPIERSVGLAVAPCVAELAVRSDSHEKASERERQTLAGECGQLGARLLHYLLIQPRKARPAFETYNLPCL